jgi:hypothetical protein
VPIRAADLLVQGTLERRARHGTAFLTPLALALGPSLLAQSPVLADLGVTAKAARPALLPLEVHQCGGDSEPVEDVDQDGTERGGVVPPENGVEQLPESEVSSQLL